MGDVLPPPHSPYAALAAMRFPPQQKPRKLRELSVKLFNPNYALQTPNNKEQIEKSVSYGVLSSLECSPKRCIPPELKIVRYLKPQGAANFTKSALLSGT